MDVERITQLTTHGGGVMACSKHGNMFHGDCSECISLALRKLGYSSIFIMDQQNDKPMIPRTKTTLIPDGGLMYPDDDDDRLVDSCDIEIDDEITDTTIEDFLK